MIASETEPRCPDIPEDLLKYLEERYPERCAEPTDNLEGLMFYGGKRDLVRWLRLEFSSQQNPQQIAEPIGDLSNVHFGSEAP